MATPLRQKITVAELQAMKKRNEKISALTVYDATFSKLIDEGGVEVALVGDSLGMVIKGEEHTLGVSIDETIYHTRCCARGIERALLVADLPFMSYQASIEQAMINAGRCLKEGGADAVKMEGGVELAETFRKIVSCGIPAMGHVGMQPQRVRQYGGYGLQGKEKSQALKIIDDAVAIEEAGAFAIVLEKIPASLAEKVTAKLSIPTIGIASGSQCDGQILVFDDMFGLTDQYKFRFVRKYLELAAEIRAAVGKYRDDVRSSTFPSEKEQFE